MFEEALDNYRGKHTVYVDYLFDISHIVAYNSYDEIILFFCITITITIYIYIHLKHKCCPDRQLTIAFRQVHRADLLERNQVVSAYPRVRPLGRCVI